ncbi:acetate--CoA ligase family protein [Dongia sedimenti]|uniref:Acetate--CoA ligase family protein n=1 Tax=Dongia sedimenti TaxID=3064282 RepID=A0ABU0YVC6_9PROT|nr:acetate--CoA ligase family protein [Rhodospirillaceae bacterium R-7]
MNQLLGDKSKATAHRLAPLLTPESVALVGASPKPGTVGRGMIASATMGGGPARIHLINPNYPEIDGRKCFASLAEVPEPVDMAVLGVANARLEAALADAIKHGVRAATIFASGYLENDSEPKLTARLSAMAKEAGVAICGGNCMGFYNLEYGLRICGFPPPDWMRAGGIAFITHSGSAFSALCHNDRRLGINLAVSAGQELATNVADYLDYVLTRDSTKVVGLFLETVRDPEGFMRGLEKARAQNIPVVALKVGRTAESAALAVSHSGAVAGNHAAYEALFDHYNVIAVDTMDDLVNALHFYAGGRDLAAGGIATMHDSGGFRELAMDLAVERKVPFAKINAATTAKLAARLDYGLEPINPLDAWGTGNDWEGIFQDCMQALIDDPDTALGALCVETRDGYALTEGYCEMLRKIRAATTKPVILATNVASNSSDDVAVRLAQDGVPVLSGVASMLTVMRKAMDRRDRSESPRPPLPQGLREKWRARLEKGATLDEAESLTLLGDYGLPVLPHRVVETEADLLAAAKVFGAVAVKTAMSGILHKSDVGGVKLNLSGAAVATAYADLKQRLGPRVIAMPMAGKGVELSFGMTRDPQFGPIVLVGAGGVLIEMLRDRRFALPPFGPEEARRHLDALALRPLLDGKRGAPPADLAALAQALSRFSVLAADLGDFIAEMDVNPLMAGPQGCVALDALIVPRS